MCVFAKLWSQQITIKDIYVVCLYFRLEAKLCGNSGIAWPGRDWPGRLAMLTVPNSEPNKYFHINAYFSNYLLLPLLPVKYGLI